MIPGLPVDANVEQQIWSSLETWSEHFKHTLAATGVDGLLREYREVVQSATTECCGHGPGGTLLTGYGWRACCGISYEYLNDISVRDALEQIVTLVPTAVATPIRLQIEVIDTQLSRLIDGPKRDPWWYTLPRTVVP